MAAVRFFYNLVFPFVLMVMLPGFLLRMVKRGKYRHKFGQRFAIYSPRVRRKLAPGGWTWVHAVSVGEVLIALKLIGELRRRDPSLRVVLSTTTSTGYFLADKERSDWLEPIYNPIDFFWVVRHAVRVIRPCRLILVEAEIWPNLTAEARRIGAPLALVNARLSPRSERRYHLIRPLVSGLFNQLDLLCVQDACDAGRWEALGVEATKILCTGSIKFDDREDQTVVEKRFQPVLSALGVEADASVLVAGSTHPGEEEVLGGIVVRLRHEFPKLFPVIVPRHAERWREARNDLGRAGLQVALREGEAVSLQRPDALLVNSTGELRDWYECADVVFVGKSLTVKGGQNPAEAISAGKAVVVGPHMENFATLVSQLVRAEGIVQVADASGLEEALRTLLADPEEARQLATRGLECLRSHRGSTARTCDALERLVSPA
jgi:3-deoxy-D-manno-octulosonic-acid transferase